MRNRFVKYSGIVLLSLCAFSSFANNPAADFANANSLYQAKKYDSAALAYQQLIAQQFLAPEVFYNLANCYYKAGNTAKAILNYERALKYKPGDEDISYNIKVAQQKIVDKIEVVPELFYIHFIHQLSTLLTADQWSLVVIALVWGICIALCIYLFSIFAWIKRLAVLFAFVFLVLMIGSWCITQQNFISTKVEKSAIVMSVSVYIKSSPGETNTDLFLLHEGSKVQLLDTYEDWLKIRIANGSIGWCKRGDVEEI